MEIFDVNTGLYLFSALLQANAAIFAIVGVFGIFRIQSLQSKIEFFKQGLIQPKGRFNRTEMSSEDIIKFDEFTLEEKADYIKNSEIDDNFIPLLRSWFNTETIIINFESIIIISMIYLGIGIIINIFFLIYSNTIHKFFTIEAVIFLLTFIYEIVLINMLIIQIGRMLNVNPNKKKNIIKNRS